MSYRYLAEEREKIAEEDRRDERREKGEKEYENLKILEKEFWRYMKKFESIRLKFII